MIPISPVSVKFPENDRAKIKAIASLLGWTESQVIRESVSHVLHLIQPESTDPPKIVGFAKLIISHSPTESGHPSPSAKD